MRRPTTELRERIHGILMDYRDRAPEDDETWESWFYAAFDLAAARIDEAIKDQQP